MFCSLHGGLFIILEGLCFCMLPVILVYISFYQCECMCLFGSVDLNELLVCMNNGGKLFYCICNYVGLRIKL